MTNAPLRTYSLILLLACLVCTEVSAGEEPEFRIGDPAPALHVSKWLKGAAIEKFEQGRVYVVLYWSLFSDNTKGNETLSKLNDTFKGKPISFIGINVMESDRERVERNVEYAGRKMNFNVAMDVFDGEEKKLGKTGHKWLLGSGAPDIPWVFVVGKDGTLAWQCAPHTLEEKTLHEILDGTFDAKAKTAANEDAKLSIGDPAPALQVSTWIKGPPVESFEKGKFYIVDCWSYQMDSEKSIRHLNALNGRLKKDGVTLVGIAMGCTEKNSRESFVTESFLTGQLSVFPAYSFGIDAPGPQPNDEGMSEQAWISNLELPKGPPCTFIVGKDGLIEWQGDPFDVEDALAKVLSGTFDRKAFAAREKQKIEIWKRTVAALEREKFDEALATLDEYSRIDPSAATLVCMNKARILIGGKRDHDATFELIQQQAAGALKDKPRDLALLATFLANASEGEGAAKIKFQDLAVSLAQRANEVTGGKDPEYLSVLARAYSKKGASKKAVEFQNRAVLLADAHWKKRLMRSYIGYLEDAGEQKSLQAGDAAPGLFIQAWAKGSAIEKLEAGHVYVLLFWDLKNDGAKEGVFQHLSQLNRRFQDKGVTVIGINSTERAAQRERVEKFLATLKDLNFAVGLDEDLRRIDETLIGRTHDAYLRLGGFMPIVYVVGKSGRIVWRGLPQYLDHVMLDMMLKGTFDAANYSARLSAYEKDYSALVTAREYDKALRHLDEWAAFLPREALDRASDKFRVLVEGKRDYDAAYAFGDALLEEYKDDPDALARIGRWPLDSNGDKRRGLQMALACINRANEIVKGAFGYFLNQKARVHFEMGDIQQAIATQKLAVEKEKEFEYQYRYSETLKKYEDAQKK